jgi:predicted metal-binding membrane protein
VVGGLLLLAAGAYQFTPLKNACLAQCQSPLSFILTSWREGARGAFTMGLRHGAFCVGCCWALMVLLFVAGVMNLAWVAAIAAFVLVEKLAPGGRVVSWVAGVVLLAWGAWVLATSLWA